MKRYLVLSLAILLVAGLVYAANIPEYVKGDDGPEVWLTEVYSAGAQDAGNVVIWAIDDSTGDNDNYVETTTTAETFNIAGVVYPIAIAAGDTGTIAIKGVVPVDIADKSRLVVNGAACTSTTAGGIQACMTTGFGNDERILGYCTAGTSGAAGSTVLVNVAVR